MAETKKTYVPVYYASPEDAYRESVVSEEGEAFRASFSAATECLNDLNDTLEALPAHPDWTELIDGLLDKHGAECVNYVLATDAAYRIENLNGYPDNFSDEVKDFARDTRVSDSQLVRGALRLSTYDNDTVNSFIGELLKREAELDKETEAEEDTKENASRVTVNENGSLTINMPSAAVIRKYSTSTVLCMPRNRGYDMFRYMVPAKNYKENGDGTIDVTLVNTPDEALTVRRRGQEIKLSAGMIDEAFSGAEDKDFVPANYRLTFPEHAVAGNYPNMIRVKYPENAKYTGQHIVIPASVKNEDLSNEEQTVFDVPDYMCFIMRNEDGDDVSVSIGEIAKDVENGTWKKPTRWIHAELPKEALLHVYDRHTLLKMPEGSYSGCVYYLPNGMVPQDRDGSIKARIPADKPVQIKNAETGEKVELTADQWLDLVDGKLRSDYKTQRQEASLERQQSFLSAADRIKKAVPDELLNEDSWIPVRTHTGDDGKIQKYAVSVDEDRPATEAMYHNIGTSFDKAVDAGVAAGADLMGFCFKSDDGVACMEMDDCLDEKGQPTTHAAKVILDCLEDDKEYYVEKSVSGKGLHVFGKDMFIGTLDTISKGGDVEMFRESGYIALTGDSVYTDKHMTSFDTRLQAVLDEFGERKAIGSPTDADRRILSGLMNAKNADDFDEVYHGKNLKGGKEYNDMSLAMRISCAANGDEDVIRRLYNASGREKLPRETLDHLTRRAVKATSDNLNRKKNADAKKKESPADEK